MHKFSIGDVVLDGGMEATIIELPDPRRRCFDVCWLIQYSGRGLGFVGHDGMGFAKTIVRDVRWARDYELKMVRRAKPLSELEQSLVVYIAEQFKELGLS